MRRPQFWIVVKTLVFTILVPGTVTLLIPYWLLAPGAEFKVAGFRLMGALPIGLGAIIYFWCAWDFITVGLGTPAPIDPPKVVVRKGLFRFVRNPMYGGAVLVILGEAMLFGSWRLAGYALFLCIWFHLFVVYYEEPTLKKKFGAAYEEYCQRVPRWLPRLGGRGW